MAAAQKIRGVAGGRKRIRRDVLSATRFDIRAVNKVFKQIPVDQMKPGIYQTRRNFNKKALKELCLLYTSPSPRDVEESRMPSSA